MKTTPVLLLLIVLTANLYSQTCDPNWTYSFMASQQEREGDPWNLRTVFCAKSIDPLDPTVQLYRNPVRNICIGSWYFDEATYPELQEIKCSPDFEWQTAIQAAVDEVLIQLNACICSDMTFSKSCSNTGNYSPIEIVGAIDIGRFGNPIPNTNPRKVPAQMAGGYIQPDDQQYIVPAIWMNLCPERVQDNRWCWSYDCTEPPSAERPCVSILKTILHEMLHCLGLHHINGWSNNLDFYGRPCEDEDSYPEMKDDPLYPNVLEMTKNANKLSCRNECALKMLYCPDEMSAPPLGKKFGPSCCIVTGVGLTGRVSSLSTFTAYPTQALHTLHVELLDKDATNCDVMIADVTGRLFYIRHMNDVSIPYSFEISTTSLPSGNYIVAVRMKQRISTLMINLIR